MTARRIIVPGAMPSRDANGRALPSKLRFYEPGTATNELKAVYTDLTLSTAHGQPILSDASGYFPQFWADDAETFDVGLSDQTYDRVIKTFVGISPADDAVLASAALSEASATAADASADAAAASQVAAAASAASALSDADRAELARNEAELIAGFDPSDYVQVASAQIFTDAEKAQARENIAAVSPADLWFHARR